MRPCAGDVEEPCRENRQVRGRSESEREYSSSECGVTRPGCRRSPPGTRPSILKRSLTGKSRITSAVRLPARCLSPSVAQGTAVVSRFGGAPVNVVFCIVEYCLVSAEATPLKAHLMAPRREVTEGGRSNS